MFKPTINQEVQRSTPDTWVYGKAGTVVELDETKGRARVFWHGDKRTWVKYDQLVEAGTITKSMINRRHFDAEVYAINKWSKPSERKAAIDRAAVRFDIDKDRAAAQL